MSIKKKDKLVIPTPWKKKNYNEIPEVSGSHPYLILKKIYDLDQKLKGKKLQTNICKGENYQFREV